MKQNSETEWLLLNFVSKNKSFLTSKICIYFIMHYAHACAEVQFVSDDILCFSQLPDASKKTTTLNYFHMTLSDRL